MGSPFMGGVLAKYFGRWGCRLEFRAFRCGIAALGLHPEPEAVKMHMNFVYTMPSILPA